MRKALNNSSKSVTRLLRFLFWYTAIATAAVCLLPWAGHWIQSGYEALSTEVRAFSVMGFFFVAAAWQLAGARAGFYLHRIRKIIRA